MVKRTNLRPDPARAFADLASRLAEKADQQATVPTGVKDLGAAGDVIWTRPTGEDVSVREVDTHVEETRQSLADSLVRLEAGEAAVQELQDVTLPALQETLDDLGDQIAAGGTTTVWSPDAPGETPGVAEGQVWLQTVSDADATVIGQWTWDGTAWKPVLIRSEVIAALDVSKLTAAEAVIATAVIDKLFAQTFAAHKIAAGQIDAESVAAAVGTFVKIDVSQLTATTADLNAVVAQKIAGGIAQFVELSADQIKGGHFEGETFVGGTFTGGVFETSDNLPGRVTISDTAGEIDGKVIPGVQVEPINPSGYMLMPYLGPDRDGMTISGGVATTGAKAGAIAKHDAFSLYYNGPTGSVRPGAFVQATAQEAALAYFPNLADPDTKSDIVAGITQARLQYRSKNSFAKIEVNDNEVVIRRDKKVNGKSTRYDIFAFDDNGLTYKQADFDANGNVINSRWTSFGDTGWINATPGSRIRVGEQLAYRVVNSVCYWRGVVYGSSSSSTLAAGATTIMTVPAAVRPQAVQLRPTATNAEVHLFLQIDPSGQFSIWSSAATAGWVHISAMSYALG